jgi:predicted short-subunit dehydrogenase-like oxidoreductase (DUF2520 family)
VTGWPQNGIGIAGTGNVAWTLGRALVEKGIPVTQVLGRSETAAASFGKSIGAAEWSVYKPLPAGTGMCIVAVSDDAISDVMGVIHTPGCLFMHTAGSVPIQVFEGHADKYGVLYPLQTMSKEQRIDLSQVPFLIEANTPENLDLIRQLARKLSSRVEEINTEQRLILHLAAVIANNFTNHLFYQAEQLLNDKGLSFDLLHPLITETARKAVLMSPEKAQTGPALRGNSIVIEKHLKLLSDKPALAEIYRMLSRSIVEDSEKLKTKN